MIKAENYSRLGYITGRAWIKMLRHKNTQTLEDTVLLDKVTVILFGSNYDGHYIWR